MSDFDSQINELIEYKKLIVKLEGALKLKEEENQKILKKNNELREFSEEMQKELNIQSQKYIQLYSENKNISKQYENKINSLIEAHENEKLKYDEKILELSAYNPHNQELKIKNDLESKYKIIIKNKDLEIENLNNEIIELKENLSLKEKELNILKSNFNEQLYTERENHSYQMKDILNKISTHMQLEKTDKENEILQEFELSNKQNAEKSELLHKELDNLRTQNKELEIKYANEIFELDTKLKEQINNNELLLNDIEHTKEDISKIKNFIIDKELEINQLTEENKKLNQDRETLIINNKEKDQLIEQQKKGLNEIKKAFKSMSMESKLRIEENQNLNKKIEELTDKLNKEQKPDSDNNNLLNSKEIQKDNINLYKDAYEEIREKYRQLIQEQNKTNKELKIKNDEISNLNSHLKKIKRSYENDDMVQKYKEANKKKNHYKQQCKNVNNYLIYIFNILTSEQKQKLENEGIFFSNNNDNLSESSKDY